MLVKFKSLIKQFCSKINTVITQNNEIIEQNKIIILQNDELIWSQIFHDSIRGKPSIANLSINVGRWAGNYTLFYILNRILEDFKPRKILEMGLGESSKFISTYIETFSENTTHIIIEQDEKWRDNFVKNFKLGPQSKILISPLRIEEINGNSVKVHTSLQDTISEPFDFYFIDGPHGSQHFSRYDAFKIIKNFVIGQEFIFVLDDYDRMGEQETIDLILAELEKKKIEYHKAVYAGQKSLIVIASKKYGAIKNF